VNVASLVHNTQQIQLQFCVKAINKIGGEGYCHLAIASVQAVCENDTTTLMPNCNLAEAYFTCDSMSSTAMD
jgi:hypothetical protein